MKWLFLVTFIGFFANAEPLDANLVGTWESLNMTVGELCGAKAKPHKWVQQPGLELSYTMEVTKERKLIVDVTATFPSGKSKSYHFEATVEQVKNALAVRGVKNTDDLEGSVRAELQKFMANKKAQYSITGNKGTVSVKDSALCGGPISIPLQKLASANSGTGGRPSTTEK